jgi:hypothetical protein
VTRTGAAAVAEDNAVVSGKTLIAVDGDCAFVVGFNAPSEDARKKGGIGAQIIPLHFGIFQKRQWG